SWSFFCAASNGSADSVIACRLIVSLVSQKVHRVRDGVEHVMELSIQPAANVSVGDGGQEASGLPFGVIAEADTMPHAGLPRTHSELARNSSTVLTRLVACDCTGLLSLALYSYI